MRRGETIRAFAPGFAGIPQNRLVLERIMKFYTVLRKTLREKYHIQHWHIIAAMLVVYDLLAVSFAYFFALFIRFDMRYSRIPVEYLGRFYKFLPIYLVLCFAVFWAFRLYKSIWRFASLPEVSRIVLATGITSVLHIVCQRLLFGRMPMSYYIGGMILQFVLILGIRFSYRFVLLLRIRRDHGAEPGGRVMVIGAGSAGQFIVHDISRSNDIHDVVCCIIDDNPNKWGRYLDNIPIVGGREDILANVEKYRITKILLAIPSASAETRRDILNICKDTGCELKTLPGMYQFVTGEVSVSAMKDVAIEDLLGRDPIRVEMEEIYRSISGKVILVTGGGGSIGSELCRQIAGHGPKKLIIFDIYENNAYEIEQELKRERFNLDFVVEIGSVRDSRRIDQIFDKYKPDIVYHAAAHKHVPLMEGSPCEAIKNNVFGTYKTAYAAMMHGCQRFVLVSTDKAVNPTNIMGASKRICEMIIQTFDQKIKAGKADELPRLFTHLGDETNGSEALPEETRPEETELEETKPEIKTEFVAVRFGNVLGSNGSVIPLFRKQIAKGGPVTVTHPDIIRYFMTIPEAVRLVMLAGTYAHGGEIFVLDMGSPVKIDTLARNLIRLSGFKPDVDIRIEYTGLRPGEKLYEEKLMAEEGLTKTENDLIHIGRPIPFDEDEFLLSLAELMDAAYHNREDIREEVAKIVNTYHPENPVTIVKDGKYIPLNEEKAVVAT